MEITCKGIPDGFSVFNEFKISTPRLILLDILLPGRSGDHIMKDLNLDDKYKNISVYFITAIPEHKVKKKSEEQGATGYIMKLFNLSDFDEIITYKKKRENKTFYNINFSKYITCLFYKI